MARTVAFPAEMDDFRRQCERQLARPLADRIRFGFFRNPNPVRDGSRNRAFASMREYRLFCERSYPAYFGYARPAPGGIESFDAAAKRSERVENFPIMSIADIIARTFARSSRASGLTEEAGMALGV